MHNLRTYLDNLETTLPGQLIKVKEPVDWRYGVTDRATQAEKTHANPALLLENIKGHRCPSSSTSSAPSTEYTWS